MVGVSPAGDEMPVDPRHFACGASSCRHNLQYLACRLQPAPKPAMSGLKPPTYNTAMHYVAPVGDKALYVDRATAHIAPYLPSA